MGRKAKKKTYESELNNSDLKKKEKKNMKNKKNFGFWQPRAVIGILREEVVEGELVERGENFAGECWSIIIKEFSITTIFGSSHYNNGI